MKKDAYIPSETLREEVNRFKATNKFNPMDVTGFYIQAAVVLYEHDAMVRALRIISDYSNRSDCDGSLLLKMIGRLASNAIPINMK